jgi:DNA-directed RNA polymerase subunit H (RpoH/RPB5)
MEGAQSIQDICFRSRQNLLKMIDQRGYVIKPYESFGPDEIAKLMTNEDALEMEFVHKEDPEKRALDPKTTEVIVITMEQIVDTFHSASLDALKNGLRIQFFWMPTLVNYPLDHVLQPKFEKVDESDHPALLKKFYARSKTQFPMIRYHADMASRCLGLIPGDIVKILRPSPSAGEYELYRICVP